MGVERTVTNLFYPNLTLIDENSILGYILADAEKLFLNVYVFVPIFSLELRFGPISNKSSHMQLRSRSDGSINSYIDDVLQKCDRATVLLV